MVKCAPFLALFAASCTQAQFVVLRLVWHSLPTVKMFTQFPDFE